MANPFSIEPANPLQALMAGVQGYDSADKRAKENETRVGRQEAMTALQGGGDLRGPLAKLIGIGDVQGAKAISDYAQNEAMGKYHAATLAESSRHNQATEGQAGAMLTETKRQHDVTDLQPVKIGSDPMRGDIFGIRDPKSPMGYRVIDPNKFGLSGPSQAAPAAPQAAIPAEPGSEIPAAAKPVQAGDNRNYEYLKQIEQQYGPGVANTVKKISDYEISPSTLSTKGGHREAYLGHVSTFDPTYDATTYPTIQATRNEYAKGKGANTVRSLNVAVDHLGTFEQLAGALNNGNIQLFNSIKNKFQEQFGDTAPTNLDAAKRVLGAEIVKAIVGAGGGVSDREGAQSAISNAKSMDQLMGVSQTYKKLMVGQLEGHRRQYETNARRNDFDKFLSEDTLKVGRQIREGTSGGKSGKTSTGIEWSIQ